MNKITDEIKTRYDCFIRDQITYYVYSEKTHFMLLKDVFFKYQCYFRTDGEENVKIEALDRSFKINGRAYNSWFTLLAYDGDYLAITHPDGYYAHGFLSSFKNIMRDGGI